MGIEGVSFMLRTALVVASAIALSGCVGSPVGDALAGPEVLAQRDDTYCKSIGAQPGTSDYTQCRMFATQQRNAGHQAAFNRSAAASRTFLATQAAQRPVNCTSTTFGTTTTTNCQ
jgi:hypothetical protein